MTTEAHARDEHAKTAAIERLFSHAVGITNRALVTHGPDPDHSGLEAREQEAPGTGVAGLWGTHQFVLTAKHVLEQATIRELNFFARPTGALTHASKLTTSDALWALPLGDPDATIHRCDWEDLALLTVEPDALGPYLEFADFSSTWIDPPEGETVIGIGYPVSSASILGQQVGKVLHKAVILTPVAFSGQVLPVSTGKYFGQFDSERHYLIPYELGAQGKHPKGISGAAVWVQSPEKQVIWAPRFAFAGICTSCYKGGTVEQIVKASVVRQCLVEVFGQPKS